MCKPVCINVDLLVRSFTLIYVGSAPQGLLLPRLKLPRPTSKRNALCVKT